MLASSEHASTVHAGVAAAPLLPDVQQVWRRRAHDQCQRDSVCRWRKQLRHRSKAIHAELDTQRVGLFPSCACHQGLGSSLVESKEFDAEDLDWTMHADCAGPRLTVCTTSATHTRSWAGRWKFLTLVRSLCLVLSFRHTLHDRAVQQGCSRQQHQCPQ
jgi:hypothetical protein